MRRGDFIHPVQSLLTPGTPTPAATVEAQSVDEADAPEEADLNRTEIKSICFFKKQNYKISATVGQRRAVKHAITPVIDSGAGPNLIHLRCVAEF